MKKTDQKKRTFPLSISVTQPLIEMLDDLLNSEPSFISRSDVVRAALDHFYNAKRPKYIYDRSASDKQKREKVAAKKTFDQMTDFEYAESLRGTLIIPDKQGMPWLVMLTLGNGARAVQVEGLKQWADNDIFISGMETHESLVASGEKLEDRLKTGIFDSDFLRDYDIDLKNFRASHETNTDQQNNDSDTGLPAPAEDTGVAP